MSDAENVQVLTLPGSENEIQLDVISDRRLDVEAKVKVVAELLREVGCEGLLLLAPENFAWLTSGAVARGILDHEQMPGVYSNGDQRWVLCCNVDSQRLFDEELDGLGFQLKEWPWYWGRGQFLADLCQGRKVAADRPLAGTVDVSRAIASRRCLLTNYEQACLRQLGFLVTHAVEATCRTMEPGLTEREIAGQIVHRLVHRGVHPVEISVAVDGRSRVYRQNGFTPNQLEQYAVIRVTGRKYGLCATCSRSVSFGQPDEDLRKNHETASKVSATYQAATWPDAVPREVLLAGRRVYLLCGQENEWTYSPQGHVTGRAVVEMPFTPNTEELLEAGWAVTWQASAGAALSCDTFLVHEHGAIPVTPTEVWPLKRIRVQGADFFRPDILIR